MTGLQVALISGALLGGGVAMLVWYLVPAQPDLGDVLARLGPHRPDTTAGQAQIEVGADGLDLESRMGAKALRVLPARILDLSPSSDLPMLRMSKLEFYGNKVQLAAVGLVVLPVLTALWSIAGDAPVLIPVGVSVALSVGLYFLPDIRVRDRAQKARVEFARALSAYIDLVALERAGSSGSRQSLENAAVVGKGSWVFDRLGEELAMAAWSGTPPWDALQQVADQMGVSDLSDLGDLMRLSGEDGVQVYEALRSRATAIRGRLLADELGEANALSTKMRIPLTGLVFCFLIILILPPLMQMSQNIPGTP